jgi:hypothetical protein
MIVKAYLLENTLLELPKSCEGEPAPDRVLPVIFPAEFKPPGTPKGDRKALVLASVGELVAVEAPDRGRPIEGCGR